ncbi:MAG: hypothetical protein ACRBN8_14140 [Nannocystales bacterium]
MPRCEHDLGHALLPVPGQLEVLGTSERAPTAADQGGTSPRGPFATDEDEVVR